MVLPDSLTSIIHNLLFIKDWYFPCFSVYVDSSAAQSVIVTFHSGETTGG